MNKIHNPKIELLVTNLQVTNYGEILSKRNLANNISNIRYLILKITLAQKREGVKKLTSEFHNASPKVLFYKVLGCLFMN